MTGYHPAQFIISFIDVPLSFDKERGT